MASQLKDIQFTSPVLNGTTANNTTTWTYGANDVVVFCGCESHYGLEVHCGCEYHLGCESHNGLVTFSSGGCEFHYGCELHCGCETHCGYETHCGSEFHCGYENHYGYESHDGYEYHGGWAYFQGSCDCSYDGFTGTNLAAYGGIAVVNPNDSSQKILLTYANLVAHGWTPA